MNNSDIDERWEPRSMVENIIISSLFLFIAIVALVGNICVILAIELYQPLKDEVANIFIINLAVTDSLSAIVVISSSVVAVCSDRWTLGQVWCLLVCGSNYCLIIVSMLSLCLISLDRYVAINYSLRYNTHITKPRVLLLTAYTWVQGLIFGLVPIAYSWIDYDYWEATCAIQWHLYGIPVLSYVIVAFVLCFLMPGIMLASSYWKIFYVVKKIKPRPLPVIQVHMIESGQLTVEPPLQQCESTRHLPQTMSRFCNISTIWKKCFCFRQLQLNNKSLLKTENKSVSLANSTSQLDKQDNQRYNESSKAFRGLVIVVLAYFICMTPFSVTKLLKVCVPSQYTLPGYVNMVATFFQFLGSAVNPLIYGLFRRDFQKAFQYVLYRICLCIHSSRSLRSFAASDFILKNSSNAACPSGKQ